jgi:hypothetical protein
VIVRRCRCRRGQGDRGYDSDFLDPIKIVRGETRNGVRILSQHPKMYCKIAQGFWGMPKPIVAYLRVSTAQQDRSGLGIEAQRAAIARFAAAEGFEITAEHVEIETGKGEDLSKRPPLRVAERLPVSMAS